MLASRCLQLWPASCFQLACGATQGVAALSRACSGDSGAKAEGADDMDVGGQKWLSEPGDPGEGMLEMREYVIKPEGFSAYLNEAAMASDVRVNNMPFLGFFTPETGGILNKVVHFYSYKGMDEREHIRQAMMDQEKWVQFLEKSRINVAGPQESRILREATPLYKALKMPATKNWQPPDDGAKGIYELREYQMTPGWGSTPKLIDAFARGLPYRMEADTVGVPVLFAFTDIGQLNTFIELWRFPSSAACVQAREKARKATGWTEAMAAITPSVGWFRSSLLRPVWWSKWM